MADTAPYPESASGAGEHAVVLSPVARLTAGVYFMRVAQSGRSDARRVVLQ